MGAQPVDARVPDVVVDAEREARILAHLKSFLQQLPNMDALVRAFLGPLDFTLCLDVTRPEAIITLDFKGRPLQVTVNPAYKHATVYIRGTALTMHALFAGTLTMARAVNERKLLLRGSMARFTTFYPLMTITPLLYTNHLRVHHAQDLIPAPEAGTRGEMRSMKSSTEHIIGMVERALYPLRGGPLERRLEEALASASYRLGWGLRIVAQRLMPGIDLGRLVGAMSRGLSNDSDE